MSIELRVIVRDDERKLTKDFNIYEKVSLAEDDPVISRCIKEVVQEFQGTPDDIKIKATMVVA